MSDLTAKELTAALQGIGFREKWQVANFLVQLLDRADYLFERMPRSVLRGLADEIRAQADREEAAHVKELQERDDTDQAWLDAGALEYRNRDEATGVV